MNNSKISPPPAAELVVQADRRTPAPQLEARANTKSPCVAASTKSAPSLVSAPLTGCANCRCDRTISAPRRAGWHSVKDEIAGYNLSPCGLRAADRGLAE